MTKNNIELKPIKDLLGLKFFIPSFQRGYRWKEQQVKDLLGDIDEFIKKQEDKQSDSFYCLQPLVVKEDVPVPEHENFINALPKKWDEDTLGTVKNAIENHIRWEVIDGQQRLTTIFILLSALGYKNSNNHSSKKEKLYSIEYGTREDSSKFLSSIDDTKKEDNIDYYHIVKAKDTINEWLKKVGEKDKKIFEETLLNNVQFIWYEPDEKDAIKVFTRINIGQIGLTNAELIKALFLNSSNFTGDDYEKIRLRQYEIASQWDNIEYKLQNEEFWLFLHETGYTNPTRIDYIFELMCEMGKLDGFISWKKDKNSDIGTDKYRTFRYFNAYFHSDTAKQKAKDNNITLIDQCWNEAKGIFQTFEEWFNDIELYHYIGYLIENKTTISAILGEWHKAMGKREFINVYLIPKIKEKIAKCKNLSEQYEEGGLSKTDCKPLLLLHNIQTVIDQNKNSIEGYKLGVFYKFPFHLYKIEKWDVEHIDSNTENELDDKAQQNEFLLNVYNGVPQKVQNKIKEFINGPEAKDFSCFNDYVSNHQNSLSEEEKNQIWNFTLLDSSTNRSYGNSIFSAKRRIIIGKDKGKLIPIPKLSKDNSFKIGNEEDAKSSFIPPCTRQIFLKYYSSTSDSPNFWEKSDAEAYRDDIYEKLKDFGVTKE
jgi:hypothetical protein